MTINSTTYATIRSFLFMALALTTLGCKGGDPTPKDPAALRALDYRNTCGACHGVKGLGTPGIYPPLAGHLSKILGDEGGRQYLLEVATHGVRGPIVIKGSPYDAWMPKTAAATNGAIARALSHAALTYGAVTEDFKPYTEAEVAAERTREQSPMETFDHRPKIDISSSAQPKAP